MNLKPEGQPLPDNFGEYEFWPNAMLPAWFVTDPQLVIQKTNKLADVLVSTFGIKNCSNSSFLPIETNGSPNSESESLLYCILDPNYQINLTYLRVTREILREHLAIFQEFNDSGVPFDPESLINKLRTVPEREGVKPYVYSLAPNDDELRIGIKVSPPQGLKLVQASEVEYATVEYVDVVMAYRVSPVWSQDSTGLLKYVWFYGVQPAIHDATERHHMWERFRDAEKIMWERSREADKAKFARFLTHAFKTPLANIQSILNLFKYSELDHAIREARILELESLIDDLSHLVRLLSFINTTADISAPVRIVPSENQMPCAQFNIADVENCVAVALQSVHNGRTDQEIDAVKVEALFTANNLLVPSQDADGAGLVAYEKLARVITSGKGLGPQQKFAICPDVKSGDLDDVEVSKRVKTVLLDLMLVELVVNAVNNSDEVTPIVSVNLNFSEHQGKKFFEIHVLNNGTELNNEMVSDNIETMSYGDKRKPLGRLLNREAARILKWELNEQSLPAPTKGALFVIGIPLEV